MSHVDTMKMAVLDLDCLVEAAESIGLEKRDKRTYQWYGSHVGDYPVPAGMTKEDLGKCDFALGVPGSPDAYEVGVVRRRDGPGYQLLWDFWAKGKGLQDVVGAEGNRLKQAYSLAVQEKEARRLGYRVSRGLDQEGSVVLTLRR